MNYVRWVWQKTRGVRWNMAIRILAGVGRVVSGLLMVWLCKWFIDDTIRCGTTEDILWMTGAIVATVMTGVVLRQTYYFLGQRAGAVQSNAIRMDIFSALFRRQLFDGHELHSGDITSRLEKDIEVVTQTTTSLIPDMAVTSIQLAGAFMLMESMDARLAWALVLLTPLFIIVGKLMARRMRRMTLDVREQESQVQMLVQETMEHQAVLRALDSSNWITGQLDDIQQTLKASIDHRARFTMVSRMLIATSFSLGYIIAFIWGGLQLRQGIITFGVMTSFLQLVSQIQQPILQMLNMLPGIIQATASIDRLEELVSESISVKERRPLCEADSYGNSSPVKDGCVLLEDVSFRYAPDENEVLSHFTHFFATGSKTAIIGETGTGKTTLFRLMLGLTQPDSGRIETSGALCFVPQGNTLMSGTIRYNLLLAKPDATDDELHDVLHTACADFVEQLQEGIDTELGERGVGLSEGQAQRIAIARGLLRPGSILLLDEISASLDTETEQRLYQRLFARYRDKTMIFITHRPAVSELCDEVIRLS